MSRFLSCWADRSCPCNRGAVIPLDASEKDEVWILANNHPVARGEIEIRDDRIAITVTRTADVYDYMAGQA